MKYAVAFLITICAISTISIAKEAEVSKFEDAVISVKGSRARIKVDARVFSNGKTWNEVPEIVEGAKFILRDMGGDETWKETPISFKVKKSGYVYIIMYTGEAKKHDDWQVVGSGVADYPFTVLRKYYELGEYTLPIGLWWFPTVVVLM